MPFFMNCTKEEVTVKAAGSYFTFKPEQIKAIKSDEIANFIATHPDKQRQGIIILPAAYEEDLDWRTTEEGKAELARLKEKGLNAFLDAQRSIIYNNEVSMARDLAQANFKHSPKAEISEGELNAMRIVAKYARAEEDEASTKMAEVDKLMAQIKKAK